MKFIIKKKFIFLYLSISVLFFFSFIPQETLAKPENIVYEIKTGIAEIPGGVKTIYNLNINYPSEAECGGYFNVSYTVEILNTTNFLNVSIETFLICMQGSRRAGDHIGPWNRQWHPKGYGNHSIVSGNKSIYSPPNTGKYILFFELIFTSYSKNYGMGIDVGQIEIIGNCPLRMCGVLYTYFFIFIFVTSVMIAVFLSTKILRSKEKFIIEVEDGRQKKIKQSIPNKKKYYFIVILLTFLASTPLANFVFISARGFFMEFVALGLLLYIFIISLVITALIRKIMMKKENIGEIIDIGAIPTLVLPSEADIIEHKECLSCGNQNVLASKFCSKCGASLQEDDE